jgi:PPM family protein phosphatase
LRTSLLLLILLALLGGGLWYGWRLTQSQYYIGESDGTVVIFRGIPGQIAGLHLSNVYSRPSSPVSLDDLTKVAQDRVRQGSIQADTPADAQRKLDELLNPANGNLACPSPSGNPSANSSASLNPASAGPTSSPSPLPTASGPQPTAPISSSGSPPPSGCR